MMHLRMTTPFADSRFQIDMRLLNTKTGAFVLVEDPRTVHYAVLSHVWSKKGAPDYVPEQTYQDVCRILEGGSETMGLSTERGSSNPARNPATTPVESFPPCTSGDSILPHLCDKIRRFCEIASDDGFELAWADTCCIDKTNPSELAEAIASMYDWYSYAKACYVFLPDVSLPDVSLPDVSLPNASFSTDISGSIDVSVLDAPTDRRNQAEKKEKWETEFRDSQWFCRGWTLQELLAPNVVIFFSKEWRVLGSKHTLTTIIREITAVEPAILRCEKSLDAVSVACRMSWAAGRQTSREEDRAYSMLGIFGVHISIVYGEGSYAFYRLQEAIINEIPDQTIFAWHLPIASCPTPQTPLLETFSHPSEDPAEFLSTTSTAASKEPSHFPPDLYYSDQYLLASSPDDFQGSSDLESLPREEFAGILGMAPADAFQTFQHTPHGMSGTFPLVKVTPPSGSTDTSTYIALLSCTFGHSAGLVALILRPRDNIPIAHAPVRTEYVVGTMPTSDSRYLNLPSGPETDRRCVRAVILSPEQRKRFLEECAAVQIFIVHRPSRALHKQGRDAPLYKDLTAIKDRYRVQFCGWSLRLLEQQGYRSTLSGITDCSMTADMNEGPPHLVIYRDGVEHGLHLEVRVGCLPANDSQALAVAVLCGPDMQLRDCDSDSVASRSHDSPVSSWNQQRGAAMKELGLISLRGESLTLRLVITHESRDSDSGPTAVYRLGVEMFGIYQPMHSRVLGLGRSLPAVGARE